MSNQGWQDGGVKSKKLEYGSKGVMGGDRVAEFWSSAGPEAGAPRRAREAGGGGQKAGGWWENGLAFPASRPFHPAFSQMNRCKWLISRI